jgi:guanylate kinase
MERRVTSVEEGESVRPDLSSPARAIAPGRLTDAWPNELRYIPRRSRVFVISGPAGSGKDALIAEMLAAMPHLRKVVTWTTRQLVSGKEREGVDYNHCSRDEFAALLEKGELLEFAEYNENLYGTPVRPLRDAFAEGLDVVLKIEAQGAMKVRSRLPGAVLVFIAPESLDELRKRMECRGRDDPSAIARRMARAREELSLAGLYDYVVVNHDGRLAEAVAQVKAIVQAERLRVNPRPVDPG